MKDTAGMEKKSRPKRSTIKRCVIFKTLFASLKESPKDSITLFLILFNEFSNDIFNFLKAKQERFKAQNNRNY